MKKLSPFADDEKIPQHFRVVFDRVIKITGDRKYCAILGPRFSGKTDLLKLVREELEHKSRVVVRVNLYDADAAKPSDFFNNLAKIIYQQLANQSRISEILAVGVSDSSTFRSFIQDLIDHLNDELVLIIDHLEGVPNDLIRLLLTSLRAIYMEQQSNSEHRLVAIVAGALSLAGIATGETSPFRGIAELVIVDLPPDEESERYIKTFFSKLDVRLSSATLKQFIRVARGDRYLIEILCDKCAHLISEKNLKQLSVLLVKKISQEFILNEAQSYDPLQEAVRLIENDPDLLICTLLLAEKSKVRRQQLPLPLSPDIDPFYLTGVVRKVGPDSYQFRNEVYRQFLTRYFHPGRVGHLLSMSGRWDQAIDYLETSIAKGNTQYRTDLLAATISSIYASSEINHGAEYLSRGLIAGFKISEARVWYCPQDGKALKLVGLGGNAKKAKLAIGLEISITDDRLEARSYREACALRGQESNENFEWAIPLQVSDRQSIGVVYVIIQIPKWEVGAQREWELELTGFLHQAARALQEVESRHLWQRQLEALDRIALEIAGGLDINHILVISMEKAMELIGGTGGGIYLWDEASETFTLEALYGLPSTLAGAKFDKDQGVIGEVRRTKQPYTKNDYFKWANRQIDLDEYKLTAVVGAPILSGDHLLGVIAIHDHREGKALQKENEELLLRIGNHVAAALQNARVYGLEQEANDYRERLISSSPDGIIAVDKDGVVTVYNEGAERICGYSRDEVIGQRVMVDKLYGDPEIPRSINRKLFKQEKLDNYETELYSKDEQKIPILLSATLLRDQKGEPSGSVGFFKDMRPLKTTVDTVNAVARARDLDEGLNALAEGLVKSLNITFCHIFLMDENGHFLEVKVAYSIPRRKNLKWEPNVGKRLNLVEFSSMKYLLEISEPHVFRKEDKYKDKEIVSHVQKTAGLEDELETVLVIPFKKRDEKVFGICTLGEMRGWDRNSFTVDRIHLADTIASQVAPLIERMQANKSSQLREGLLKAGKEITSLQELPKILKSITDSVKTALRCDLVTLYTYDEENGEIGHPPVVSGDVNIPHALEAFRGVSKESVVWKILETGQPHFVNDSLYDQKMLSDKSSRLPGYHSFVERENICSSAGIPLIVGAEKLGILFVNYRFPHPFIEQEKNDIQIFADKAAMAIHNARLYEDIQKREKQLRALYDATNVIARGANLNRKQLLDKILELAISITSASGEKATLGTIQIVDEQTNEREFTNVYALSEYSKLRAKLGKRLSLDKIKARNGIIGITGRAIVTGKSQLVSNVKEDSDYIEYSPNTKSELAVPLLDSGSVIGAINVESDKIGAFDASDQEALEALADLTLAALQNLGHIQHLSRANKVAMMGAWGADVVHDVKREVGAIRKAAFLLQRDFDLTRDGREKVRDLDRYANALALHALPQQSSKSSDGSIGDTSFIDNVAQEEVHEWKQLNSDITIQFKGHCDGLQVAMHEQWVRRLLRHFIRNAINAIPQEKSSRKVIVRTNKLNGRVEVSVEDTGKGIQLELVPKLFIEPILREDGTEGQGLLLVSFLAEQHGGKTGIKWNRPGYGACFYFTIPIA